ncbi:sugar phosphate isomerase/epimerase family protein [Paenibacillus flagellatus]|uniref:sugar phosphate isomerase/epimerase family protein n=1 Tax=Paenibacillus flagellatus TaxID=2211139 RepID=UPI0013052FEF|nr:sugar phosphate isomerase/epimerase family protein [Paenibacillus flagellatus]
METGRERDGIRKAASGGMYAAGEPGGLPGVGTREAAGAGEKAAGWEEPRGTSGTEGAAADARAEARPSPSDPARWPIGASLSLETWKNGGIDLNRFYDAGIRHIEMAWRHSTYDMFDPDNEAYAEALVVRARRIGLDVWTMHLPYGTAWDVSVVDDAERAAVLDRHGRLLRLARRWGIGRAVLHPSWEPIAADERPARVAACKRALPLLAAEAERQGVRIAVECLPRTCLGNTSAEMLELVGADERLGVCCDVNHLLQERSEHFIRRLAGRIVTVHMSDYDGVDERHWLPGKGVIRWNDVIGALAEQGYAGPFLFEVRQPDPDELAACWERLLGDYVRR